MDEAIAAAARALAAGDPLGALNRVSLRDDAPCLALRGTAMAQLGDLGLARTLLRQAARAFGPNQAAARARCVVAGAEVALVSRDLSSHTKELDGAAALLEEMGDRVNAAHARYLAIRHMILIGRLNDAERALDKLDPTLLPPVLKASHALVAATLALRRVRAREALRSLAEAEKFARLAGINALVAEVESVRASFELPVARLTDRGSERLLKIEEVEEVLASGALVVDACRRAIRDGFTTIAMATRPVLFELARALAEAWPEDVTRERLVERVFELGLEDDLDRLRLRVEVGRLRTALEPLADVVATKLGYVLAPRFAAEVVVLALPVEERHADVLALLADGESWSSSALALALGSAQRTVQRALEALAAEGKALAVGGGRSRRWMTPPVPGFATCLLLPGALPGG